MIIVVMGVAGSGKSTIGTLLSHALGCPLLDGDSLHSAANVEKMARGIPLTPADRAPWLDAIHARLVDAYRQGQSLVAACSALEQSSRTTLAEAVPITWVYLKGPVDLIRTRLQRRTGHFMKDDMLASQVEVLEEPVDAIVLDITRPPGELVQQVLAALQR